jgi:tetratricopeptide (TPR) repeat protein
LKAQVLKDTTTFNLMRKGIDYIYNLQFTEAYEVYYKINDAYPGHPMTHIFKGLIIYWEHYPLISTSAARNSFEKELTSAIELSEKKHPAGNEAEYTLASIGARGLLLMFYADNDLSMDVISLASSTYPYVKLSFDYTSKYADFYFITGLYNYYREAYPEAHPVYKPLAILFPKGDKKKGLSELQVAAKNAIVLKAESYSFLSGIYISFENNFRQALVYSKSLHDLYPNNNQYLAVYIKNLLLEKRYNEAENLVRSSRLKITNLFYQAQLSVFNGIIYEKKYHDLKTAQSYYEKGIRDMEVFGPFADDFKAYAYFGLCRISEVNGDKQGKKNYHKMAMDLSTYKNVNFDE